MSVYFDTAYIAKCYVNEPDSGKVRTLLRRVGGATSSSLALAEMASILLRHEREGGLARKHATRLAADFTADAEAGVWNLLPVSEALMRRVATRIARLPASVMVRAADAIHLVSASEHGFSEAWTNDRHMLAAAPHFGITGRTA